MQLNSNEIYRQSGSRAGEAAKNQDWSFVTHEKSWLERALINEDKENRQAIRQVWGEAYKSEQITRFWRGYSA
tara:strand:+ start:1224 stop:1442 length:219 start_codon:yes stop_codon:yes gene_type:complete